MVRSTTPLALEIGPSPGPGSLSGRLANEIVRAIARGRLRDGDTLPSTRSLASAIGVARSTVVLAYEVLAAEGYVRTRPGSGTLVEKGARAAAVDAGHGASDEDVDRGGRSAGPAAVPELTYDLVPGYPDVSLINSRAWEEAWRSAQRSSRAASPFALELRGIVRTEPQHVLRAQLCAHLRRTRGIVCDPDDVFVYPDAAVAAAAVVAALDLPSRTVAIEDPGSVVAHRAFGAAGCRILAQSVDDEGMSTDGLDGAALAYVTPSHQHPLGVRMSAGRRRALLAWARRTGATVVEDDHDGPFHHDGRPVPTLRQSEGGENHVIHLGMTQRLLNHQLMIAWLVVPTSLRERFRAYHRTHGNTVCPVTSMALAEFIRAGAMTRHLARSRRVYRARASAFTDACARVFPQHRVMGAETGMNGVLDLDRDVDDVALARALHAHGLACLPLSPFYSGSTTPRRSGLVCGFARLPEELALPAARLIADVMGGPAS